MMGGEMDMLEEWMDKRIDGYVVSLKFLDE